MNMKLYICKVKVLLLLSIVLGILLVFPSCQYEAIPATKGIYVGG